MQQQSSEWVHTNMAALCMVRLSSLLLCCRVY